MNIDFKEFINILGIEWEWEIFIAKYENEWGGKNLILNREEHFLLYTYINSASLLNEGLRQEATVLPIIQVYEKCLNDILDKLPNYFPKSPTFRGCCLNTNSIEIYKKACEYDDIHIEWAFFSTSKRDIIAKDFSENVFMTIRGRKGKDVSLYADKIRKHEKEVLFKSKTQFQVIELYEKDKITYITLEEIQ